MLIFQKSHDVIDNRISNYSGNSIYFRNTNYCQIIANKINFCITGIAIGGDNANNNNFVVSNNLITNCETGIWSGSYGSQQNGSIFNNVIHNSASAAVTYQWGFSLSGTVDFYSNIFSNNAGTLAFHYSVWNYNCVYNSGTVPTGTGNIASDPLFTNPGAGDFSLQAGSPCINTGDPTLIYSDIDRTRNDMGIYGGSYTMSNYENLSGPEVISLSTLPIQVIKGYDVIITGSGISK